MSDHSTPNNRGRWALILLLVPYVALLFPGWYAQADPRFSGIPFFIWYQFAWVILGVGVTAVVYFLNRGSEDAS
jgi:hypothetical protein